MAVRMCPHPLSRVPRDGPPCRLLPLYPQQIFKRASMDHVTWRAKSSAAMMRLQQLRMGFLASVSDKDRTVLSDDALGIGMRATKAKGGSSSQQHKDGKARKKLRGSPRGSPRGAVSSDDLLPLAAPLVEAAPSAFGHPGAVAAPAGRRASNRSSQDRRATLPPLSAAAAAVLQQMPYGNEAAWAPVQQFVPAYPQYGARDGSGIPTLPSVPSFGPMSQHWQVIQQSEEATEPLTSPFAITWPTASPMQGGHHLQASPTGWRLPVGPAPEAQAIHTSVSEPSLVSMRRHPFGSAESLLELANAPPKPASPSRARLGAASLLVPDGFVESAPSIDSAPHHVGSPNPRAEGGVTRTPSLSNANPSPRARSASGSASPASLRHSASESSLPGKKAAVPKHRVVVAAPPLTAGLVPPSGPVNRSVALLRASMAPPHLIPSPSGAGQPRGSPASTSGPPGTGSNMDLLLLQPMGSFGDFLTANVHRSRSYSMDDQNRVNLSANIADIGPIFDNPDAQHDEASNSDGLTDAPEMI